MICLWIDKKKNLTKQKKRGCKSLDIRSILTKKQLINNLSIIKSLRN